MSGHTPGPWTYHERGAHPHPFICGAPESTEWGNERFVVAYLVGTNIEGNAHLIKAAPDMLAALRDIANYDSSTHSTSAAKVLDENAKIAREAIAKAEGKP